MDVECSCQVVDKVLYDALALEPEDVLHEISYCQMHASAPDMAERIAEYEYVNAEYERTNTSLLDRLEQQTALIAELEASKAEMVARLASLMLIMLEAKQALAGAEGEAE